VESGPLRCCAVQMGRMGYASTVGVVRSAHSRSDKDHAQAVVVEASLVPEKVKGGTDGVDSAAFGIEYLESFLERMDEKRRGPRYDVEVEGEQPAEQALYPLDDLHNSSVERSIGLVEIEL
jgi:hypothetical protein